MTAPVDLLQAARERGVPPEGTLLWTRDAAEGEGVGLRAYDRGGLERAVETRAGLLAARGVEGGRIHPVVAEADETGVLTLLALWRLGAVPAPLNPRLTPTEREQATTALEGRAAAGAQVVLWTSGTSGRPRGVALGWAGLAAHVEATRRRLALDPARDHWLASLPLAHVGGLVAVLRALLLGCRLTAVGPVSTEGLLAFVEGGLGGAPPGTHLSLVPTQLHRLLDVTGDAPPPATLRCVLLGGAHTPRTLLDRALAAGWPVALTYGMTEMSSQVATAPPEDTRRKPGSVGAPLDGVELRVDGTGEIHVRGATRALTYLDGPPLADADGWYATGDLGRVDGDGHVWVTGRRMERIVTGGVNVDAVEVEEVLRRHPSVVDACVVGVPDEEWGEVVAACVVPVAGEFDEEEVAAWLGERMAGPKRPRLWRREGALPLNASGKVDRLRVRDLFGAG